MERFKSKIRTWFSVRRGTDRVYVYDEDVENFKGSCFLNCYSLLGCVKVPRPTKYDPYNFSDVFRNPDIQNNRHLSQTTYSSSVRNSAIVRTRFDDELNLEEITL